MSIEITGPSAYDYQYLATVYAALCILAQSHDVKEMYLEKPGSEDGELVVELSNGDSFVFEIQVKSEGGDFMPEDLAHILCHFPAHKFDNNLAQRLLDDTSRRLIAVTKARCNDTIKGLAVQGGRINKDKVKLHAQLGPEMLASMALFDSNKTTALKIKRFKYCQAQSAGIAAAAQENRLLDKVIIWELEDEENLLKKCQGLLYFPLNIPLLQTKVVLDKLIDLAKAARTKQRDIAADFKSVIHSNLALHPVLPTNYIARSEEPQLIALLEQQPAIYLKGSSFCGKSLTALSIASHFTHKGYDYKKFSRVEDAERFLVDTNVVDRVAVLDDPMEHHYQTGISDSAWLRLQNLAKTLPPGKKLIVTANNDVLVRLKQHGTSPWHDLTNADTDFTQDLLTAFLRNKHLSNAAEARIRDYIDTASPDKLFQPGQLDYLINNWEEIFLAPQTDLYEVAAIDAHKIIPVLEMRGPLCVKIYRILGLCCDMNTPVSLKDLGYILAGPDDKFPGIKKSKITTVNFADLLTKNEPGHDDFPHYDKTYHMPADWQTELDFLSKCGFIRLDQAGYIFRHPYYFEASKLLVSNLEAGELSETIAYLKRSIGALSVQNAIHAAKRLQFIFSQHSQDHVQQAIIDIAFFGIESIFPAVADLTLIFLAGVTSYLSKEKLEEVLNDLSNYHFDSSSVSWHNGTPYRPQNRISGRSSSGIFNWLSKDEYEAVIAEISNVHTPLPTAEKAWQAADYFRAKNKKRILRVDETVLDRLLNYDEAFIRSIAGYQVFRQYRNPPEPVANKALNDPHPFVVYQSIKGFMRGWPYYSSATKRRLLPVILKKLEDQAVLVSATHLITQFGIGYAHYSFDWLFDIPPNKHRAMWKLWVPFATLFFEKGPRDIRINAHRFISTVQTSEKFLTVAELNIILINWAKFLLRSTVYHRWDTTLFAVNIHTFNILSKLSESQRLTFLELFLFSGSETFTADCLRLYELYWDELLDSEKEKIVTLLNGHDPSGLLKAIVLTGRNCPAALSSIITGKDDWQKMSANERVRLISRDMLEKCISINYVTHRFQELHGRDLKAWNNVLGLFLDKPDDLFCKVAIKVLADDLAFKLYDIKQSWGKPLQKVEELLKLPDMRSYIFDIMLEELSETTCSNFQPLWIKLFARTDNAFHLEARKAMANLIERIEMHDNFPIVLKLFGNEFFHEIPVDATVILMMDMYRKSVGPDEDILNSIRQMIGDILPKGQLRLSRTYDLMREFVRDFDPSNQELGSAIEVSRHAYFEQDRITLLSELRERNEKPMAEIYIN